MMKTIPPDISTLLTNSWRLDAKLPPLAVAIPLMSAGEIVCGRSAPGTQCITSAALAEHQWK
jgi:hypothetical protein